jgi:hypothetical protein
MVVWVAWLEASIAPLDFERDVKQKCAADLKHSVELQQHVDRRRHMLKHVM